MPILCVIFVTLFYAIHFVAILPYPTHRRPQDWCQAIPEATGNKLFER